MSVQQVWLPKNFRLSSRWIPSPAVIVGNNGKSDVAVVSGNQAITFEETLDGGAVQTTTITKNGSSVHSRHTMGLGRLTPSQYYGTCK
jgi:hypothetical protein